MKRPKSNGRCEGLRNTTRNLKAQVVSEGKALESLAGSADSLAGASCYTSVCSNLMVNTGIHLQ